MLEGGVAAYRDSDLPKLLAMSCRQIEWPDLLKLAAEDGTQAVIERARQESRRMRGGRAARRQRNDRGPRVVPNRSVARSVARTPGGTAGRGARLGTSCRHYLRRPTRWDVGDDPRFTHNPDVTGSNPVPATTRNSPRRLSGGCFACPGRGAQWSPVRCKLGIHAHRVYAARLTGHGRDG